jgi:hypothetical protein
MDPLAAAGLLLSLLCVASPLHKPIRQLCKQRLIGITIKQLPWVAAAQTYVSRPLDVAVLLSAATITLEVYLTLIPLLLWSGWAHEIAAGLLPHLALSGYVVFAIKDLLVSVCCWLAQLAALLVLTCSRDVAGPRLRVGPEPLWCSVG